jgi:hypothetical protein
MRTECGHEFHTSCVMMNIRQTNNYKCPYCREMMVGQAPTRAAPAPAYARDVATAAAIQMYFTYMNGPTPDPNAAAREASAVAIQAYHRVMDGHVPDPAAVRDAAEDAVIQAMLAYHPDVWEAPAHVDQEAVPAAPTPTPCIRCGRKTRCGGGQQALCQSTNKRAQAYDRRHPRQVNA